MAINKISDSSRNAIIKKSVMMLPNNPSEKGFKAEAIKRAMYDFVTGKRESIIAELDRLVDEINLAFNNTSDLLVSSGFFDSEKQKLFLVLNNDKSVAIDVSKLVNKSFCDSETLIFKETSEGKVCFEINEEYKSKIEGIESGAQKNVQTDWNQNDPTADDYLKNRPIIPEGVIVEDNLESEETTHSLSARQGNVLSKKVDKIVAEVGEGLPTIEYYW